MEIEQALEIVADKHGYTKIKDVQKDIICCICKLARMVFFVRYSVVDEELLVINVTGT